MSDPFGMPLGGSEGLNRGRAMTGGSKTMTLLSQEVLP